MKLLATIFAIVMMSQPNIINQNQLEKRTIMVTVPNVTSNKGKVHYALYTKEGFMKKPLQAQGSIVKDKKSTVVFTDVAPGEYAIICFHDANNNDTMDFDQTGMPLEDYGVSNNPMSFGSPNFDEAVFEVSDKDVTLEIRF